MFFSDFDFRSFTNAYLNDGGVWSWIAVLIGSLVITTILKFALNMTSNRVKLITDRMNRTWDDLFSVIMTSTKSWTIFIWVFYLLLPALKPDPDFTKVVRLALIFVTGLQAAIWMFRGVGHWRKRYLERAVAKDASSAAAIGLLCTALQGVFVITIVLIGLSNMGVDIGALIAGLGVGGIAVALAAQNVLGDLFASLSIVLDKPFVVGDFIVVGNELGTVENIGLKTTRVRSLSGEELVFSNKDLLESRIRNFKRMWQRRVVKKFGVKYSTPTEKLQKIPIWVKEFVEREPKLRFDRCHFADYGSSSLDFELVFFVLDPDFNAYMDLQQRLLFDIFKKFGAEGIEFGLPAQRLYVEKVAPQASPPLGSVGSLFGQMGIGPQSP